MLKVHFLNVGKGNCTVIKFPSGNLTIVDIDNSIHDDDEDVLQCPIKFIDSEYPNESVFRFVVTHPDMDHMSGLSELHNSRNILNFWDTDHNKKLPLDGYWGNYNKNDWVKYLELRTMTENPKALHIYQGDANQSYWKEDGITILGPSRAMLKKANDSEEYNHCSYVLRIEYEGVRILLGGDATKDSWLDIFEHHGKDALAADVFLAPHHGSPDNIEKDVFSHINPQYVIVSDQRGHSYDYAYYKKLATKELYSTKHVGNVTLEISADVKQISVEKEPVT